MSCHVLLGARSSDKGTTAVAVLQSRRLPGTVEYIHIDVEEETSIIAAAKLLENKYGRFVVETDCRPINCFRLIGRHGSRPLTDNARLDGLVNNAGIASSTGTISQQMTKCFLINAVGAELMVTHLTPLLKKSTTIPRIVNVTSGAGSIGNLMDPNGLGNEFKVLPYRVSKAAMNMVSAFQYQELGKEGIKVFLYGPGPTVSSLSVHNTAENGMKPTSMGASPIVDILKGHRDVDAGKFLHYGMDSLPW